MEEETRGRKKENQVRWNLERAAAEFGTTRKTLSNRLLGTKPDTDGRFSTKEICGAIYGDLEKAKIRLAEATAGRAELRLAKEKGAVVAIEDVAKAWGNITASVRLRIAETTLSEDEKVVILADLRDLSLRDYSPKLEEQ